MFTVQPKQKKHLWWEHRRIATFQSIWYNILNCAANYEMFNPIVTALLVAKYAAAFALVPCCCVEAIEMPTQVRDVHARWHT